MDPWSQGATALIPRADTVPAQLPELLRQSRATLFAAAPGVYRKMLQGWQGGPLPDLRHGLSAGEKLSERLHARWRAATGRPVYEAYGLSECSTFISSAPAQPAGQDALGRPQPGRRVAILGRDGPVAHGETGIIAVDRRDPGLMLEYLGAPEATRAKFQDGWFLTGDLGSMAEDGTIRYVGRADDVMNAGGHRVSPAEVEGVLATFPGILAVAVTDIALKTDTRVIAAFYVSAQPLPEPALRAFAAARLARYKQPRVYMRLPDLPTGPNGKLRRRALQDIGAKEVRDGREA